MASCMKHFIVFLIMLGASLIAVAGNSYRTDLLERMAKTMNIAASLDKLQDGIYYRHITYNNRNITIIVVNHEIAHIGYSVFTPTMRQSLGSTVCDFLERYSLEISLPLKRERSIARQLEEDGIFFRNGDFSIFKQFEQDTTYSIHLENLNSKRYMVSWSKDGKDIFSVNFPIERDLLVGTEMIENERRILQDIPKQEKGARNYHLADSSSLKMISWQKKYYLLQGGYYYTKQLNSNKYFEKIGKDRYNLFYKSDFVLESLTNMMTTGAIENDYDLQIRLVKYGFTQDTIQVKLNQWINYCIEQGCWGYFGIISTEKGIADCELIMRNNDMNYIHLMRMLVDISTLEDRKGLISARLNCYIPTNRIKYLFEELKL